MKAMQANLNLPVYLDYNATTPCDDRVVTAMLPYFTKNFGNAGSNHFYGWQASEAVKLAREQVCALIGARENELIFTSGATEAVNLAIKGVWQKYSAKGSHIVTTRVEHKAVLDTCAQLERWGAEVTYLEVQPNGRINTSHLQAALRPDTVLVAIMFANNETGVIMPVEEIGAICKKNNVFFFSDATQAVGKIEVDVDTCGIDLMAFSAHKMYGPKGVGALYTRRKQPRVSLEPQIAGGNHQNGIRSGTLNVAGIVGLGAAAALCLQQMKTEAQQLNDLRNLLETKLLQLPAAQVNGDVQHRLPHVSNMAFAGVAAQVVMSGLAKELAISAGSACTAASISPSHVLTAMGLSSQLAHSALRFSLGRFTTKAEITFAIEKISAVVNQLTLGV